MLIKILLVIAILIQTVATAYALKLVRATKYNSVWILSSWGFRCSRSSGSCSC